MFKNEIYKSWNFYDRLIRLKKWKISSCAKNFDVFQSSKKVSNDVKKISNNVKNLVSNIKCSKKTVQKWVQKWGL
jgi:gas vesicle protein